MTTVSTTVKIIVSMVVAAALVATRMSSEVSYATPERMGMGENGQGRTRQRMYTHFVHRALYTHTPP